MTAAAVEPPAQGASTDAVESLLNDFRSWLRALPPNAPRPAAADEGPDLHTLLGQFVALRHEVNLQTKAVRSQQEQSGATLQQLTEALGSLRQAHAAARAAQQDSVDEAQRPLVKVLVDLHDSLALANREVQRVEGTLEPLLDDLAETAEGPDSPPTPLAPARSAAVPRSFLGRLFGAPSPPSALEEECAQLRAQLQEERQARSGRTESLLADVREAVEKVRQTVDSLVTGYGMSVQRVERALRQHGLETIPTVGERFDPDKMEVLEVVYDSGRPSGEVLDEVRRGYLWSGRVFRCAQVRVAKSI